MGAKYVSGSMRGAGSVEKSRLFSFTRSSICCSPAPTLFTDSCHYLRLMRFYPISQSTLFTETRTTNMLNKEVSQRGLSVSTCGFRFSTGWNKCENELLLWNKHKRIINICSRESKGQCVHNEICTNTHLCVYTHIHIIINVPCGLIQGKYASKSSINKYQLIKIQLYQKDNILSIHYLVTIETRETQANWGTSVKRQYVY